MIPPMERPDFQISLIDAAQRVTIKGAMTLPHATTTEADFQTIATDRDVHLDLSGVTRFDTSAAWIIASLDARLKDAGQTLEINGTSEEIKSLLRSVTAAMPTPTVVEQPKMTFMDWVASIGQSMASAFMYLAELVGFLGLFLARLVRSLRHPKDFRLTALFHHCEEVGLKAVPIVALMAFLIGVVLAFQGSTQLKQFGAEVFVVDLIAISILRELGILLTSIIVAGRTASAFTAAIGSMKMREEIDAMASLGLDPAMMLFVPRILALVIMLPILGLIANVMGLLGGGLMAWIDLGISPALFMTRLVEGTDINHVIIGMVKAPVFALIIGVVGCHAGMQVKSNAESLGRMTSSAVVAAIFAVIVADALFSIFFAGIGM
ncbi:MlaE family lipid ABC transporter permease subunit [Octadecabacter sp. G9-8]|uniref:MlaE family lipid ABC transporter permease subunit n=1 Tax=Octadecabacter dasysiphoniae TaxID=2909341 RepID=A0ABS9CZ58_9RHOB|nr:MlaE family lipid ABC transporter permease subunit [Octadecabacter dasysiphoniae]MCF2872077.1 MlaE family lipid ABC transporter permease subunit [Octadecabacter dasysiphoniae]